MCLQTRRRQLIRRGRLLALQEGGSFGRRRGDRIWVRGELVGQYLLAAVSDLLRFVGEEVGSGYSGYYSDTLGTGGQGGF